MVIVVCTPESAAMLARENDVCHNVFINLPQVHTILVQCGHSNPHGQSSIPHEKEILDEWVWHQQCGCQGAIYPLLLVCILVWWDIVAKLWCLVKEHRGQHLPEHCPAGLWLITFKFSILLSLVITKRKQYLWCIFGTSLAKNRYKIMNKKFHIEGGMAIFVIFSVAVILVQE